jgi:ferredoxin
MGVRVRVDADRCMGHGMCAALVGEVYEVNEDTGFNEMGEFELPEPARAKALRGVSACPERAIAVLDDVPAAGK